jgi:hypothetical protein
MVFDTGDDRPNRPEKKGFCFPQFLFYKRGSGNNEYHRRKRQAGLNK